jgi:hypothetical protein
MRPRLHYSIQLIAQQTTHPRHSLTLHQNLRHESQFQALTHPKPKQKLEGISHTIVCLLETAEEDRLHYQRHWHVLLGGQRWVHH